MSLPSLLFTEISSILNKIIQTPILMIENWNKPIYRDSPSCEFSYSITVFLIRIVLYCLLAYSYAIQIHRIVRLRTSSGLSIWYTFLCAFGSWCNAVNIILQRTSAMQCCMQMPLSVCTYQLLDCFQLVTAAVFLLIIFACSVYYFPQDRRYLTSIVLPVEQDDTVQTSACINIGVCDYYLLGKRDRLGVQATTEWITAQGCMMFMLLVIIATASFTIISINSNMLDAIHLREWKHPLGIFNLILLMIQSSCQLWTTWYGRESGALSARSLGFQVLVNFPLVCMLTFQKDVDWTIWSTQLGIFLSHLSLWVMCLYWDNVNSDYASFLVDEHVTSCDDVVLSGHSFVSDNSVSSIISDDDGSYEYTHERNNHVSMARQGLWHSK